MAIPPAPDHASVLNEGSMKAVFNYNGFRTATGQEASGTAGTGKNIPLAAGYYIESV